MGIGLSRMEYKLENDRIKETKISSLSFWSLEEAIESLKRKTCRIRRHTDSIFLTENQGE